MNIYELACALLPGTDEGQKVVNYVKAKYEADCAIPESAPEATPEAPESEAASSASTIPADEPVAPASETQPPAAQ